ncbi:hypothetical protein Scuro_20 [Acinetobacter phage Scuro]|nr:hypothetical protein Scuro_20 [Acinetobacter phage Scuro]
MKTGIVLQAGYHNYYNQFEKVKLNAVFFGIKFQKGADNNTEVIEGETVTWNNANTRCYIGNLVHTVGCLSLWLECCETLYVNNMYVEDISSSDYSDELPTLDKMPTAVFISEKGTGNRDNNKNSIQKMMSEACHRVVENYGKYTNINVYAERWKDYPNGSPFVGKPFTNGFQESPVPQIKDLRNVDTYSLPVVTRGINITNADYTANPSIATAFPSGTRIATELYGNVTYFPIAGAGQVGNERMEFLYSSYPENKFYHRRSNVSGSQNNPWIPLVERWGFGQNYLVHDATKTLDTLFVANGGLRSYQVSIPTSAPSDVKASLPRPSVGEFYGAVLAQSTSKDQNSGCLIAIGTYPKGIFIKFFGDASWQQIQTTPVS